MKKVKFLVLPLLLCLTGCQTFEVGYDEFEHDKGLDKSVSGNSYSAITYSYYGGDQYAINTNLETANITFAGINTNDSNVTDIEKLNSYVVSDKENFFETIENPYNVGTNEEFGLYLGVSSTYAHGEMTLVLNKDIKNIEIVATPYYFYRDAWNEEELVVDQDSAISVNGSPFIRLSTSVNEAGVVNETTCKYQNYASENKNKVTLRVGPTKAFIKKITLYY